MQTFVKTVREFNAAVQPGHYNPDRHQLDGKCTTGITPPKSNYALEIDEAPFEAWPVRCGITFTFGGLKIDPKTAQVQHVAGRPIPGLFAAGEMVGRPLRRRLCVRLRHDVGRDVRADRGDERLHARDAG